MAFRKSLAQAGAVGETARWAVDAFKTLREKDPASREFSDADIFNIMVSIRLSILPNREHTAFMEGWMERGTQGLRSLVTGIIMAENGMHNALEFPEAFRDAISEELQKSGLPNSVIEGNDDGFGSKHAQPSPSSTPSPIGQRSTTEAPRPATDEAITSRKKGLPSWAWAILTLTIIVTARLLSREFSKSPARAAPRPEVAVHKASVPYPEGPGNRLGSIVGSEYRNSFFRITVPIPPNWTSMESTEAAERLANGTALLRKQNSSIQSRTTSDNQVLRFLNLRPKSEVGWNALPSFNVYAEPTKQRTPIAYLNTIKNTFSQLKGISVKFGELFTLPCNGGSLSAVSSESIFEGQLTYATFAVTESNGYLIIFATSCGDPDTAQKLNALIGGIVLNTSEPG